MTGSEIWRFKLIKELYIKSAKRFHFGLLALNFTVFKQIIGHIAKDNPSRNGRYPVMLNDCYVTIELYFIKQITIVQHIV